jgi:hypothetical protein
VTRARGRPSSLAVSICLLLVCRSRCHACMKIRQRASASAASLMRDEHGQEKWGEVSSFVLILQTCYYLRPLLWCSSQSSWQQIQRSGFDSRLYHIFCEVVGLQRDPLRLVTTTEGLLEWKSSGFSLEIREYGSRDLSRWSCGTPYPQKFVLTSPTSGGRFVGIVRSRQATEFSFFSFSYYFKLDRISG